MLALTLFSVIALALLAVGAGAFALLVLHALQSKKPRAALFKQLPKLFLSLAVLLLALFSYVLDASPQAVPQMLQALQPLQGGAAGAPTATAFSPSAIASAGTRVLETKTEEFTRELTPLECEETPGLVYWRELRVYNVSTADAEGRLQTSYYSTITLNVFHNGTQPVYGVVLKEKIPSNVALLPEDVMNYSKTPLRVVKGSVVVEWLFDEIEPGENQNVSYTVEKKLSKEALQEFETPKVVAQSVGSAGPTPKPAAAQAGVDWTVPGLVAAMAMVGAVVYFFARKMRAPQE
ncbi:MAG: hypothetical protein V1817_03570 [Candidatus Micrarchaeota archaeon]